MKVGLRLSTVVLSRAHRSSWAQRPVGLHYMYIDLQQHPAAQPGRMGT